MANDLEQIQAGMNNLSQDLTAFFEAVQQWLQTFRSILANDAPPQTDPAPDVGSVVPSSMPTVTPSITFHEPVPVLTAAPDATTTSQSSLCRPAAGAGPLVPCPESRTTSLATITSTSTRSNTITAYETVSYVNASLSVNDTAVSLLPTAAPYPSVNVSFAPTAPATLSVHYISTTTPAIDPAGSAYMSTLISYSLSPTPTPYAFNATSQDNVVVYYGTSPNTQIGGLLALCANPNVDIVILSFVYDFSSAGGYPTLDFGPACLEPNGAQRAAAPGLKDCSALAPEIAGCQQIGKKVLVSLGGYSANSSFASAERAAAFAETVWNLFGAGDGEDPALRPFGPSQAITIDGFDVDNEDHSTDYYDVFATSLREHFAEDPGKTYYLSAAPQCPMPDASIPMAVMAQADFVWVQFYNNPSCNLDTEAFQASFATWSSSLADASSTEGMPRLYVGVPAFAGAGLGYVDGAALYSRITQARELDVPNLGGIMLWEGTEALTNVDQYGVDYLSYAKDALHL